MDGPGFRDAVRAHLDLLFRVARLLVPGEGEAEDLVQQVCLRAFERRGEGASASATWLTGMLRDIARLRQRGGSGAGAPGGAAEAQAPRLPPASLSFAHVLPPELDASVRALGAAERLVLWLSDVEAFRYEEIAEVEDTSVASVRATLARARAALARELAAYAAAHAYLREDRP